MQKDSREGLYKSTKNIVLNEGDGSDYMMNHSRIRIDTEQLPGSAVHEYNHSRKKLHDYLFTIGERNSVVNKAAVEKYIYDSWDFNMRDYVVDPTEIHSKMMEVRFFLNKQPGEKIKIEELQMFKEKNPESTIHFYYDDKFLDLLNKKASIDKKKNNLDTIA